LCRLVNRRYTAPAPALARQAAVYRPAAWNKKHGSTPDPAVRARRPPPAAQAAQGLQPGAAGPRWAWRTCLAAGSRASGACGSSSVRRTGSRRAPACRLASIPRQCRSRRRADQAWQFSAADDSPGRTSKAARGAGGLPARLPSPLRGLQATPAAT